MFCGYMDHLVRVFDKNELLCTLFSNRGNLTKVHKKLILRLYAGGGVDAEYHNRG